MNEVKFTPGPWIVRTGLYGKGRAIAHMDSEFTGTLLADIHYGRNSSKEEGQANAHLISAAPEMFEILNTLYELGPMALPRVAHKIGMVLEKARGEVTSGN
jgi:hypothetical protein